MPALPNNPDLERFRRAAKDLLRSARAGKPSALAKVATTPDTTPRLAAAQRAVARAYGFASWARLRHYLDTARPFSYDPTREEPGTSDAADAFCRFSCLLYSAGDGADRWAHAAALLEADPDLPRRSISAAAAAADPGAISEHLARDAGAATRLSGPHPWPPLLYLTYSRVHTAEPPERFLQSAGLLLAAGADPDAGYLWSGLTPPFTALTGVFGEGEQGPAKQPRHPHEQALARVLLRAGADPNDGQTLYNRMFGPDDSHLKLLFEFGLGRRRSGPWARRLGDALDPPERLLAVQLAWALGHGFDDRVRLLLDHGVDVRSPLPDGRTPAQHAVVAGRIHLLPELYRAGAAPAQVAADDELAGRLVAPGPTDGTDQDVAAAKVRGATQEIAVVASEDAAALDVLRRKRPDLIHLAATPAAVAAVAAAGFDVDARSDGATALHRAAFTGDIPLLAALLAAGANPAVRDDTHQGTAVDWARYAGQVVAAKMLDGGAR